MRKMRYKEASSHLKRMASPAQETTARSSVGMEKFVGEFFYIALDKLIPFRNQAREKFDEEELQQLADTIKEHGIRQPLTVLKSNLKEDSFEVVSGERRLRAAKIAGLEKVPCIIIKDPDSAEEIALIENVQRTDLHPVELGDALSSLLSHADFGNAKKLSKKIGKSESTISQHISYSKLPVHIKKRLVEKNIRSTTTLRKLVQFDSIEKMETFLGMKNEEKKNTIRSILRINLDSEHVSVQDKQVYKLNHEQIKEVKKKLIEVLEKIDRVL